MEIIIEQTRPDQLVSVVSQQDAMVFTFAQANSRICVGKKAAFYCMIPIEDSEDETDAAECEEVSPAEEMGVNDMENRKIQVSRNIFHR